MGKRKRGTAATEEAGPKKTEGALNATDGNGSTSEPHNNGVTQPHILPSSASTSSSTVTIQIVTGSYERVLHGITATVSTEADQQRKVTFADTFLFNAHSSSIRCLALSSPSSSSSSSSASTSKQPPKVILASGSTDERINLYHLSASPPPPTPKGKAPAPALPTLIGNGNAVVENPKNRELGSLLHHSSSINALYFPTRAKLLSSAEDNTIAVTRTRDWTLLSTIKAPIPIAHGRPSGDTAPAGGIPVGVNDFAVHPSMKLMLSVGKGERCMRLWNLVTGKKAGVLNYSREMLKGVGEGKWGSGEGRRVIFDNPGEEFVVGFERGAVVFGLVRILSTPLHADGAGC